MKRRNIDIMKLAFIGLAYFGIGALSGGCTMSCDSNPGNSAKDVVDEIGDEVEDVADEIKD